MLNWHSDYTIKKPGVQYPGKIKIFEIKINLADLLFSFRDCRQFG